MKNIYFLTDRYSKIPAFYFDTLTEISDFFEDKKLNDFDLNFLEKVKKEKALLIFLENSFTFLQEKIKDFELILKDLKTIVFLKNRNYFSIRKFLNKNIKDCFFIGNSKSELVIKIESFFKEEKSFLNFKTKKGVGETLGRIEDEIKRALKLKINSLLVWGESGVGKEVVADTLKEMIKEDLPFYKVNCASLPLELFESELFGYEKGSFTGAHAKKEGILAQANGGWVFLDEIACLPMKSQASLLRFLETGEIRKIGETKNTHISVKILAATNESLEKLISKGTFRKDLLERLRNFEIEILPFRKRSLIERKDILNFLLVELQKKSEQKNLKLTKELKYFLLRHHWKDGNMREIKNTLETIFIKSDFNQASLHHLPNRFFIEKIKKTTLNNNPISFFQGMKSQPREQLNTIKQKWFLFHLEQLSKIKDGKKINKKILSKHLDLSPWKISQYLQEIYLSGNLPDEYNDLVDHNKGLSEEVYFSDERKSLRIGST